MGFSVSGSAAIIFAAMFIAFGMWHSATTDGFERVTEAQQDHADDTLAERNTDIEVRSATYSSSTLTVVVTNNGTTALSMNATDVFVDNEYRTDWEGDARIDDAATESDLWLPAEKLTVTFSESTEPSRVKVVTEHGVGDQAEVV